MIKKLVLVSFFFFFLFLTPFVVSAQKPEDWDPPEKNGVYDVPGKQNLKVRVFVHEPRDTQFTPELACIDDNSSAVVHPAGWKLHPGDWTYSLNPSSVPSSVGSTNLPTIAANSYGVWQSAINNKVKLVKGADTTKDRNAFDGINLVAWGRTSGSALAVTYTWYYPSTGFAAESDTIMNKKFTWGWSANICDSSYYDAQNILTHELGHWIGLNDEYTSPYVNNTMYGYGSKGEIKKDTLTAGDVKGATNLYN